MCNETDERRRAYGCVVPLGPTPTLMPRAWSDHRTEENVTFVKLVERWTLDIRRIFEISPLEYTGIYYNS